MPILDKSDSTQCERYEEFVRTSPYGSMLQSLGWAKVKDNWESDYVYLEDPDGNITAAMSVLSVKNDGQHAFMYAPRGPVCDLYDTETIAALVAEAQPLIEANQGFLLRLDAEVPFSEDLVRKLREDLPNRFPGFNLRTRGDVSEKAFSNPRHHMILQFKGRSVDDIIATYHRKFRYQIRRTYKDGLQTRQIRVGEENYATALDTFYELTQQMARRKGITHRPQAYFDRLLHAFEGARILETFDAEGEVLASCIVVSYANKAFYMYAASSDNKRELQPSLQMVIEAIRTSIDEGLEEFDFGGVYGVDVTDGLYLYKYKYCGDEGLHEYIGELDFVFDRELYDAFNGN